MLSSRVTLAALVAAVVSISGIQSARADFSLVSDSMTTNAAETQATFTLTFNQKPNFTSSDSYGRQADSFQIEFDGKYDGSQSPFNEDSDTAVVRGEEIHLANALRVRSPVGDGGAGSGGWGPILTTVPFSLSKDSVAFTIPAIDLGWSGGDYRYTVSTYTFGSLTSISEGRVVPLPPAVAMGGIGLVAAGIASVVIRRRAAR